MTAMRQSAKTVASVLNALLIIIMCVDVGVMIYLPFIADQMVRYFIVLVPTYVFFYVGGAACLWFLFELHRLIVSVRDGNPFTRKNVKILHRLAIALAVVLGDFIFIFFYVPSYSKLLCIGVLVLGVLCALVLAHLIERAAEYREEIDLTV